MNNENVIIIGSGPAGYTAAIYAARANLKPIIISGAMKGGQLTTTTEIENFPGFPNGINGTELMLNMLTQVTTLGVDVVDDIVTEINKLPSEGTLYEVKTKYGVNYQTKSIIIATGSTPKKIGVKGEDESWNRGGISTCATCDGFFYRNKEVVVVGGGDTALEEVIYLSNICSKVHLFVRGTKFKGSDIMAKRVQSIKNVEIHFETSISEFIDDDGLKKGVSVSRKNYTEIYGAQIGRERITKEYYDGIFVAVGTSPNVSFLEGSGISIDNEGYIINPKEGSTSTNLEGVYSAGDVSDKVFKQAIISAGSGSKAAIEVQHYLNQK